MRMTKLTQEVRAYETTENNLRATILNQIYCSQENFDKVLIDFRSFIGAFKNYYLRDIVCAYCDKQQISHNRDYIRKKIDKLLKNSVVVIKSSNRYYEYVREDYNRELQSITRMKCDLIKEDSVNKALIRRHIRTKTEINRKAFKYDRHDLSIMYRHSREQYQKELRYPEIKKFAEMSDIKKAVLRHKRKARHKIHKKTSRLQFVKNVNTEKLLSKLSL